MKLNCDLGEQVHNNDALIMPYIDQANIACGFHASNSKHMLATIKLAIQHKVEIGAHPSYPDKTNFGRVSMELSGQELLTCFTYQIAALQSLCELAGTKISYVKPHGALYNDMMADVSLFELVCQAISLLPKSYPLMILAIPKPEQYQHLANKYQITLLFEGFADRAYQNNGQLVARSEKGAVLTDQQQVIDRITELYQTKQLKSIDGQLLNLTIDSLCVHGDNQHALALVKALKTLMDQLK